MLWQFDGSGQWEAQSQLQSAFDKAVDSLVNKYGSIAAIPASERSTGRPAVDACPLYFRIVVCDDGTFDVSESDSELMPSEGRLVLPKFHAMSSLALAKSWCAIREARLMADATSVSPRQRPTA